MPSRAAGESALEIPRTHAIERQVRAVLAADPLARVLDMGEHGVRGRIARLGAGRDETPSRGRSLSAGRTGVVLGTRARATIF